MNGKQAKRLRRAAMGLAVTLDSAGNTITQSGYETRPPLDLQLPQAPILNRRNSVRGIYRTIKKGVVTGKIGT